jgi:putative ABC transport system permease protein
MHALLQNVRFALRQLRRSPGFATVAILTLALGIGATTAIFSVVYATMLAPMPYPHPEQLVLIWSKARGNDQRVSVQDYLDWKAQNKTFQAMIPWGVRTFNMATTAERPQQVRGGLQGAGMCDMEGEKFSMGRDFLPEEAEPGKDHEVILPHATWKGLGADPNMIGKTIRIDLEPYTVVGVLAPGEPDRLQQEFFVPLSFKPEEINRQDHPLLILGRLKPGVSLAAAEAELQVIAARIAREYPQTNQNWGVHVTPLRNFWFLKQTQYTLWALLGAVGFLLLISCANVANLLLAKASTRRKEVAVRASLGATRTRVFMQFLTESLVLSATGGVLGIALAEVMLLVLTRTLLAGMGLRLPAEADIRLSLPVLLFTFGVSLLAGVLFGCAPAWRVSALNVNETLKESGRSGSDGGHQGLRRVLVVSEFGLALALLAGAGLAIRSFWNLTRVDLGLRTDHILTFGLPLSPKHFAQPQEIVVFYHQLVDKLYALPGVSQAEVSTSTPLADLNFGVPFDIVGQPHHDSNSRIFAFFQMATPEYFKTFGIQLLQGRTFTAGDIDGSPRVAVVNEHFVHSYLSGVNPIGQRILVGQITAGATRPGPLEEWQIIGVVRDARMDGARDDIYPEIDVPFDQSPFPEADVAIRTAGDPGTILKSATAVINSMDPDLPMAHVKTMDQVVDDTFLEDRSVSGLFVVFAVAALLLAAIGIYGVMSFSVAQRTHEIGLRMALGADRSHVLRLILREGLVLAVIGLGLGLLGGVLVGHAVHSVLYQVGTIDLPTLCGVAVLLLAAGLLASYLPARRATRVDPMVALRCE